MRRIDTPLLNKIKEQNQTLYNGNDPRMSIQVSRAKTTVMDSTYWTVEEIRTKAGLGDLSVAARRQRPQGRPDMLFNIYVDNGIVKTATRDYPDYEEEKWIDRFSLGSGSAVALCLDGYWELYRGKWQQVTSEKPWLFWVNGGRLYAQYWDESDTKIELATNVSKIKAIRGWVNLNIITQDQGVIVGYIKTDGKVYYRNYCRQANGSFLWEDETQITQFTGTAKTLNLFITNDYRTGFAIEDMSGKIHLIITRRAWAGMGIAPDYISATTGHSKFNFIPMRYLKTYNSEKLVAKTNCTCMDLLYASSYNEMSAMNIDDGTGNFGKKVLINTRHCMFNVSASEFRLANTTSVYNPTAIEVVSDTEFIVSFSNFNNADGDLELAFTRQTAINEAGYPFGDMITTFTPEGLVYYYNPPEVINAWNEDAKGKQIGIQLSEPLINGVASNENAFALTGQEYLYVNGPDYNGVIIDKEYEAESTEAHPIIENAILITLKDLHEVNNVIGDIIITYDQAKGTLAGSGGAVESFTHLFVPINLEAKPNPGHAEKLSTSIIVNDVAFKRVAFSSYNGAHILSVATGNSTFLFQEASIINP